MVAAADAGEGFSSFFFVLLGSPGEWTRLVEPLVVLPELLELDDSVSDPLGRFRYASIWRRIALSPSVSPDCLVLVAPLVAALDALVDFPFCCLLGCGGVTTTAGTGRGWLFDLLLGMENFAGCGALPVGGAGIGGALFMAACGGGGGGGPPAACGGGGGGGGCC